MALVQVIEAELARASEADAPALLLRLGRTMPRTAREPAHAAFLADRRDMYSYNEPYGAFNYNGAAFEQLIERFPQSELADDAAYEMTLLAAYGECEGWNPCYIDRAWAPLSRFLTAYPESPLAAHAVDRALAAFDVIAGPFELRYPTEEGSPDQFSRLAAELDNVGGRVAPPHGHRLSERAAQIFAQLGEYPRARGLLASLLANAGPESRSCLESQVDRLPNGLFVLEGAQVLDTSRVALTWQMPPDTREFAVFRSTAITDIGELVGQPDRFTYTWTDSSAAAGQAYWYRVTVRTASGVMTSNPAPARMPRP